MAADEQDVIKSEFSLSWDKMEQFYQVFSTYPKWYGERVSSTLSLISELRKRGYDRKLRAGQQLSSFVLSRSRLHGLRSKQAHLSIYPNPQGGMSVSYYEPPDVSISIELESVGLTAELEEMLTRLLTQPID